MKYKLINSVTKIETLCDKVTIDGFDYYVSDNPKGGRYIIWLGETVEHFPKQGTPQINYGTVVISTIYSGGHAKDWKEIIATTNPNIDVPKVVDEVENIAYSWLYDEETENKASQGYPLKPMEYGFIKGYNKSQETHPFSEEDMIEFGEWCKNLQKDNKEIRRSNPSITTKELLQLWKEQKTKTIYYE